jgi:Ca2+-binding RTX toxin-like protein
MTTGTSADDILNGTTGDDTIDGLGGSDAEYGDTGNDSLLGGDGDDFLRGQDGADTLEGGAGEDFLNGGVGDDLIDGGAGIDRASFGDAPGGVSVNLSLTSAQSTGFGTDTLIGVEQVSGTAFNDLLTGDGNANWLWTLGGADTVSAAGGDDLVSVGAGAVRADGGAGVDTLSFYSDTLTGPVRVSLAAQGAAQNTTQGSMTLTGFENRSGTAVGGDTLTGDANANVIAGWGGSDSLVGGAGNDTLLGDGFIHVDSALGGAGPIATFIAFDGAGIPGAAAGNDTLDGGAGDDDLRGEAGADSLLGGDGEDFLRGQDGSDTLQGGAGQDFLNGGAGDDLINGGAGIDRASFGDAPGGVSVNLSLTSAQNTGFGLDTLIGVEQVSGTAFNDVLTGDGNANWLWTLGGADTVSAGGGGDLVSVGAGAVQANGGAGVDTLSFYSDTLTGPVTVSLAAQGAA